MSTLTEQKSFSDYLIESIFKSIASNTINTGFDSNAFVENLKNFNWSGDVVKDNWGALVSNSSKIISLAITELIVKSFSENGSQAFTESFKKVTDNAINITSLSVKKYILDDAITELNQQISLASTEAKRKIYQLTKNNLEKSLSSVSESLSKSLIEEGYDIDRYNKNPREVINSVLGKSLGDEIFKLVGNVFNAGMFIYLMNTQIDKTDSEQLLDYSTSWVNLGVSISGIGDNFTKGISGILTKVKGLPSQDLIAMSARGLFVGILTDITYKLSYAGAEWAFSDLSRDLFGKELYEMEGFIKFTDNFYQTIFQHLEGNELNAVITFNTMILGNFVNPQGKSVVYEDTAVLFGVKDYQEMSFEKALNAYKLLHKAITGTDSAQDVKTADEMIKSIEQAYPLFKELRGKTMIIPQTFKEVANYDELALQDNDKAIAYRFSLKHLLPMVITDLDYSQYNQNSELELYAKDNPNGMTAEYLKARSEMLGFKLQYLAMDIDFDDRLQVLGVLPLPVVQGDHIYHDLDSQLKLDIDGVNPSTLASHYKLFGGTKADTLTGGELDDKLFADVGNDTLIGLLGDDYLEGGKGSDTYHIKDHDTIFDADGKGQIVFGGYNYLHIYSQQKTTTSMIFIHSNLSFV